MLCAGQMCSRRSVNQRTKLTMRHGFLCGLSSGRTPRHRPEVQQHLLQTRNALHQALISCYMAWGPSRSDWSESRTEEGVGFITTPKSPRHPQHQSTFPSLLHPHLPRGHRKHTTNQPAHCPTQHPAPTASPGALLTSSCPRALTGPTTSCPRALTAPTTLSCTRAAQGPFSCWASGWAGPAHKKRH